ncbi:MAG: lantibiotic dehydratase, partial [Ferruginibacter sp.]|nr:lantibiotic dehydratase [Cytophagales bacterium]
MEVFPHVLVRVGGGAFNQLARMACGQLATQCEQLAEWRTKKEQRKGQLSERLFAHIQQLSDAKAQNAVQNVRRDLFNDRTPKATAMAEARKHLTDELQDALNAYLAILQQLQALTEQTRRVYEAETGNARAQLQRLAGDDNLQKGLILSSQTFLDSLLDYHRRDLSDFRKKEYHTEYTLLRYLTRMCAKTSPFSTFNNLALGDLQPHAARPVQFEEPPDKRDAVTGHIRLNTSLFRYLKDLFAASRLIYRRLPLRPNPTIDNREAYFQYLTNHNNIEAFQRIPANPVVSLMLQLIRQQPDGLRFDALGQEVLEYVDAPAEEIENYVQQLVGYGFLEYDLGVSGTDPDWDLKLVEKLQPLVREAVPHLKELVACLRHIRALAGQYAAGNVDQRKALLQEAFATFRSVCMALHEAAGLPAQERKTPEERTTEERASRQHHGKEAVGKQAGEAEAAVGEAEPPEQREKAGEEKADAGFRHQSSTFFSL